MAKLIPLYNTAQDHEVPAKGFTFIGRADNNNIQILAQSVSRTHARIQVFAGQWTIVDLESTFGTYINNRRIRKFEHIDLCHGDIIQFGSIRFRFES
jgi:pSer/pThr/pTyr-binding forkhead associated (FHA) protein